MFGEDELKVDLSNLIRLFELNGFKFACIKISWLKCLGQSLANCSKGDLVRIVVFVFEKLNF